MILDLINTKLDVNLTGNEISLILKNKNIGNYELKLLSAYEIKNLENLDLSHNNISNTETLDKFNLSKIKNIDLSFNNIHNLNHMENMCKKLVNLEVLNIEMTE